MRPFSLKIPPNTALNLTETLRKFKKVSKKFDILLDVCM